MADFSAARLNMVESQVRPSDVTDIRIHDAMRTIPRETFVPQGKAHLAYADASVEYAPGRFLLNPRAVAKLLQLAEPVQGERALAISAPYAAAVLQYCGVAVTAHDGQDLCALPGKDYDLIVVEGAVARVPPQWLEALAPEGRLAVIERHGPMGRACLFIKHADGIGHRIGFDAAPPVLAGFEAEPVFTF